MAASDVIDILQLALQASGLNQTDIDQRPRLLSDNGPSYIAADLSEWLDGQGVRHARGRPFTP